MPIWISDDDDDDDDDDNDDDDVSVHYSNSKVCSVQWHDEDWWKKPC